MNFQTSEYRSEPLSCELSKGNRSVKMGFRQRQIKAFRKKHHLLLRHINLLVIWVDQSKWKSKLLLKVFAGGGLQKGSEIYQRVKELYLLFVLAVLNPLSQLFFLHAMEKRLMKQSKQKEETEKGVQQTFSPASIKFLFKGIFITIP